VSHPAACRNPESCDLSYVEHLRGFVIGVEAMPTRAVHRTPGLPDEPAVETNARQRRWDRELDAFKTLCVGGAEPETLAESPKRLQELGG
jgi:hypothetical protein